MSSIFYILLGWDGLGIVSFFLIIYYLNSSRISSGIFRLIINRIGDSFFILGLILMLFISIDFFQHNYLISNSNLFIFIFIIAFLTKTAIFPFSRWLPIAIAAPTPISSLVHSSTLVTAGLYLFIRFSYIIYSNIFFIKIIFFLAIYTSFYAGLSSLFENDYKKLIALSTLRHLGFILIAFSLGLLKLAFFHLLVHALFKSLLFIRIGNLIRISQHEQDGRFLSHIRVVGKYSSYLIIISIFSLLSLPRLRGFFTKDLILEFLNFRNLSIICIFLCFLNVVFTFIYSLKLRTIFFTKFNISRFLIKKSFIKIFFIQFTILRLLRVVFVRIYFSLVGIFLERIRILFLIKIFPLIILIRILIILRVFIKVRPKFKKTLIFYSSLNYLIIVRYYFNYKIFSYFFNHKTIGFTDINYQIKIFIKIISSNEIIIKGPKSIWANSLFSLFFRLIFFITIFINL